MLEVAAQQPHSDAGLTSDEWAAKFGRGIVWTRKRLNLLKAQGKIIIGVGWRENLNGPASSRPVYRLKPRADDIQTAELDPATAPAE